MSPKVKKIAKAGWRARVRSGWDDAGCECEILAIVYTKQMWAVVLWDDREDPDCFKFAGLESML